MAPSGFPVVFSCEGCEHWDGKSHTHESLSFAQRNLQELDHSSEFSFQARSLIEYLLRCTKLLLYSSKKAGVV
jgi:hypothetical protein